MDGKSQLKSPSEILAIAKKTKFNEAGGYESKHDGGSIQYVPPEVTPDEIGKALVAGLLLYKFTIKGTPPKYINLTAGTYYFYMQYLDGKWIGVAVDQEGKAGCLSIGLIARQIITVHPGKEHQKDFRIVVHPIAPANDLGTIGFQAKDVPEWVETTATWKPIGGGPACITTTVCVPKG